MLHTITDNVNIDVLWCHSLNNLQLYDTISNLVPMFHLNAVLAATISHSILRLRHYYFTKLLSPTLFSTAKISPDGNVRIVNTSSMGHMFCCGIDFFQRFQGSPSEEEERTFNFCMAKHTGSSSFLNLHQYPCHKMNLPVDIEARASFLPLLTPENIQTGPQRNMNLFQYPMILEVNTNHILHTIIPSLRNYALGCGPIVTFDAKEQS